MATVCKLKISPAVLGVVVGSKRLLVYKLQALFMSIAETRAPVLSGPSSQPQFSGEVGRASEDSQPHKRLHRGRNSKISKTGAFARASSILPLALRSLSPNPKLFAFQTPLKKVQAEANQYGLELFKKCFQCF